MKLTRLPLSDVKVQRQDNKLLFPLCLTRPAILCGIRKASIPFIADQKPGVADKYFLVDADLRNWLDYGELPYDLKQDRPDDLWVGIYQFEPILFSLGYTIHLDDDEALLLSITRQASLDGYCIYNNSHCLYTSGDNGVELTVLIKSNDQYMRKLWHNEIIIEGVLLSTKQLANIDIQE